nr:integrase, catalytic region, zinc finger, CCHC-type, peptidase aspartic, catalytic [Tanacetum cinerariifolium]
MCKLLAVGSIFFWQWEHPPLVVGTYTASGNSLLAVGMPCAFYSQQSSPKLDAPSALKFSEHPPLAVGTYTASEMASEAKRYLDKSSEGSEEVFPGAWVVVGWLLGGDMVVKVASKVVSHGSACKNGVNILKSIDEGPYQIGTVQEPLAESIEGTPQFGLERPRVYSDLSPEEKDRYNADIWVTNILLQGLPKDIYTLINHYTDAKDIWDNHKGESIHDYYVQFTKLINDMRNIKMTMSRMQLNSKFVNNMLPEWGRFVTAVKLNRGPRDSNYDQLYAYLKQHETHAKENKMMLERFSQNIVDPLALMSNVSNPQRYSPSSSTSSSTQVEVQLDMGEVRTELGMLIRVNHDRLSATTAMAQENGVALDAKQLLFLAGGQDNSFNDDVDEQPIQDLALNVDNVFQADDCDAFDFDVDEAPTTQTMFMANLSSTDPVTDEDGPSYDSDILSEVQDHDHYQDAVCAHQKEPAMHDSVQLNHIVDSHADYTSDSNMIPYDQYVKDNEVPVVHSNVSSVPSDAFMMIYNDMCEPHAQSVSNPSRNTVVENSLTAELATYKEQVKLYEMRVKFELTEREQKTNEQLRLVISDRNFKEETLKNELHSIKLQLTSTINHNKSMIEEVTFMKKDFKQKENKYLEEFLDMKSLKEKVKDRLLKQDQSLQTVYMLCRPNPYYNELNKVAIGYKNPLCLTRAKKVQPALYNGHEILKDNHVPAIVHNTEDTLEIVEITRKKMHDKMKDPECVTRKVKIVPHDYSKENFLATFTPHKQLTPEQIFWVHDLIKLKFEALKEQTTVSRPIKALTVYPPNTPATLVPKVLPTKIQVKIHIFTLIQLFLEFDKTCKKRITPAGLAEGKGVLNKPRNVTSKRAENDKIKKHYKELYDSIKITRAKHIEQVTALTTKNVNLNAQILKKVNSVSKDQVKPKVLARGKYAINVELIVPFLRNDRDAHLDYLKHLKESVETIRDIVEEAKVVRPLDRSFVFACHYTKHSQELLEYVIGTCPQGSQQRAKQLAYIPLIRKKQVTFAKQSDTLDSNTHKHVVKVKTQKTNVPVPPYTGVNSCPNASESQPKSNTKTNRISPAKGVNELPVEDQPRTNKSHLRTSNCVDSSSCLKRTVVQIILWYLDSGCLKHMMGDRLRLMNFVKKFIGTVRFWNDHFGAIMGYGDYVIGDSVISRVYYVEGMGHNLFSVRQFCDSDLEVAFRKHSCYV